MRPFNAFPTHTDLLDASRKLEALQTQGNANAVVKLMTGAKLPKASTDKMRAALDKVVPAASTSKVFPDWREYFSIGFALYGLLPPEDSSADQRKYLNALLAIGARGEVEELCIKIYADCTREESSASDAGNVTRVYDDVKLKTHGTRYLKELIEKKDILEQRSSDTALDLHPSLKTTVSENLVVINGVRMKLLTAHFAGSSDALKEAWAPLEPIYKGLPDGEDWMKNLPKGDKTLWKPTFLHAQSTLQKIELAVDIKKNLVKFDDVFWAVNGDMKAYGERDVVDMSEYVTKRVEAWNT